MTGKTYFDICDKPIYPYQIIGKDKIIILIPFMSTVLVGSVRGALSKLEFSNRRLEPTLYGYHFTPNFIKNSYPRSKKVKKGSNEVKLCYFDLRIPWDL